VGIDEARRDHLAAELAGAGGHGRLAGWGDLPDPPVDDHDHAVLDRRPGHRVDHVAVDRQRGRRIGSRRRRDRGREPDGDEDRDERWRAGAATHLPVSARRPSVQQACAV
jgi:hypothetical protein